MIKYRILQLDENDFQVQFCRRFIWRNQNRHGSIESARRCIKTMEKNDAEERKYPRVVK